MRIICLFILSILGLYAQSQMAYLYTEVDTVYVGDPFEVKLEWSGLSQDDIIGLRWDTLDRLEFTDYSDTTNYPLDIEVDKGKFKGDDYIFEKDELEWTLDEDSNPQSYSNTFTFTVWEMAGVDIPGPVLQLADGQEIPLNPLGILVLDPLMEELQDLAPSKSILKTKRTFWEFIFQYIWIFLPSLIAGFAILMAFIIRNRRKKRGLMAPEEIEVEEIIIPAHEIAIEKLSKLKEEQGWAKGDDKAFISELTEIVREYIENRFGVQALEMTTSQIINALEKDVLNAIQIQQLSNSLNVADMIKFAKAKADEDAYEQFVDEAIDLVETTKKIEEKEENDE